MSFAQLVFLTAVTCGLGLEGTLNGKSKLHWDQQEGPFQGDIGTPETRNALFNTSPRKWPNGIVYYEYNEFKGWTQGHMDMLQEAMKMIEKHTCVKFVKRTNQANYFNLLNGGFCLSQGVGMFGGKQPMLLKDSDDPEAASCWDLGTIMHELLHVVGLWHEQMRYDRDEYIELHPENFKFSTNDQFAKIFSNVSTTYDVPYNYRSIMHYSAYAFSKNKLPTMTPKKPGFTVDDVGRGEKWEYEGDWEKVRRIYNCQGTFEKEPCLDTYNQCDYYKTKCRSEAWMKSKCPKTCGFCPEDQCRDELTYCYQYVGQCAKLSWMTKSCRKLCKLC